MSSRGGSRPAPSSGSSPDNPKEAVAPLLLAIRLGADDARICDSLRRVAASVQADDRLSKAMLDHGRTLERKGDLDGTLAAYREATRLDPKNASAHFAVGRILHRAWGQDRRSTSTARRCD